MWLNLKVNWEDSEGRTNTVNFTFLVPKRVLEKTNKQKTVTAATNHQTNKNKTTKTNWSSLEDDKETSLFCWTTIEANICEEKTYVFEKRGTSTITVEEINIPKWIEKLVKLKLQWHKITNVGKNVDKLESWYVPGKM